MSLKGNLHNLKEKYKGTKMAPAFNAIHTFLYLPNEVTHGGTHIKAADDLKRTMNIVIMALIPCLLFGMFNAGYQHYAAIDNSLRADVLANFFTFDNLWIGIKSIAASNCFLWSWTFSRIYFRSDKRSRSRRRIFSYRNVSSFNCTYRYAIMDVICCGCFWSCNR